MKLYGLYSKKQNCPMSIDVSSNGDADFCSAVSVSLSKFYNGDQLWVTSIKSEAEEICKKGSQEWYNTGFKSPEWNEDHYGKLEVIELN